MTMDRLQLSISSENPSIHRDDCGRLDLSKSASNHTSIFDTSLDVEADALTICYDDMTIRQFPSYAKRYPMTDVEEGKVGKDTRKARWIVFLFLDEGN